jgi:FkbM family methyltransferase
VKVFLDVGAHFGETLPAVLDPRFGFDRVYCFEPAPECWPKLRRAGDDRVVLCRFGLWKETADVALYDAGSVRGSIFDEAKTAGAPASKVRLVRATEWFRRHLPPGAAVYTKLNVEGSECDILDDLVASGEIERVASTLVHFDVRRFPSQRHREDETRAALDRAGYRRYVDAADVPSRSIVDRVQRWLREAGAEEHGTLEPGERLRSAWIRFRYSAIPAMARTVGAGRLGRRVLPTDLYLSMRSRLLGDHFRPRDR